MPSMKFMVLKLWEFTKKSFKYSQGLCDFANTDRFQCLLLVLYQLLHMCRHTLPMRVFTLTLLTVILLSLASHVCRSLVNSITV